MSREISRERFESGMSYEAYKAQMTRNKEQFERNEQRLEVPAEDLAAIRALPQALNVLVLAEDWCGDVINNLPVLGRLARDSGKLNVRVLLRDQNVDIMNAYLKDGQFQTIPLFVFLDEQFKELGVFQERPASVTRERDKRSAEIFKDHPEFGTPGTRPDQLPENVRPAYQHAMAQMREALTPWSNTEVVRAIRGIASGTAAAAR